ncbi:MFS transporter [Flagellimonas allohymeniacidonis]|uniref:MFS transporter n=1 Tax=Flagellimonas allohymeniacidonis TaxID=2517819 RepID=A0A4Q8QGI6_9FLAO|nr:MFS transporter [Allomuricauda hymeniacidonis]TAI48847.1 MFS transporter [Allomuricauda hymeniacidonis]
MAKPRMYGSRFILVCLGSLFFSASYNMLIPELPAYLTSLGGAEYIGLIIALFTLTAGLSRPFSGKLTDTIGRRPVMLFGAMVCLGCGFLYPISTTVTGFLLLRLVHGFSTGFTPTATSTYVSDIVPKERLGEAMGIQGIAFSTGLALGPALGSLIKIHFSYTVLFWSSSGMALLALVLMFNLGETLKEKKEFKLQALKISRNEIIAREAIPAGIVTLLSYMAFGVVLTLIPDWSVHVGIANKGTFFIVFTISSLLVRFVAGSFSDRHGRMVVIVFGLILLLVSTFLMGYLDTSNGLLVAATLYGLAMGVLSPAINAWTIDLSNPKEKGKAIATMYIALEAGIGLGALLSGWYYQGNVANVPGVMYACSATALLALAYLTFRNKMRKV